MGLTDELEALRQSGSVKSKSAGLDSAAAASTSFITPEAEAERRRFKALQEKQSRLEAKNALHSNNYGGEDDLNSILLNKKLIEEQRAKKKEAERNLRQWRRKHHDGIGGGGKDKKNAAATESRGALSTANEDESDETRMNRDALEMLPEHVVSTLKAKYETNNAEIALERALHEEETKHGHGKGRALAKLMEITLEEEEDEDETVDVEEDVEHENEEYPQLQPSSDVKEEDVAAADEEWAKIKVEDKKEDAKEDTESMEQDEEENGTGGDKVEVLVGVEVAAAATVATEVAAATTSIAASNPTITRDALEPEPEPLEVEVEVEEVREKIEHLSIDEVGDVGEEKEESLLSHDYVNVDNVGGAGAIDHDNDSNKETKEHPPSSNDNDTTTTSSKNYDMQIEQTKRFYNLHAQEYIDYTSNTTAASMKTTTTMDSNNLSLSSSSCRDTFIEYILQQQQRYQSMDNSTINDPSNSTLVSTSTSLLLLDLGCGYGRDTYHFTSTLGHRVLGIDYSIEMLQHAKRLAPMAHYLNMDIRQLSKKKENPFPLLVDQSLDGIWANSSLLHVPKCDILGVLQGLYDAIKVGGVFFMSLKLKNAGSSTANREDEAFEIDERYTARKILPSPDDATTAVEAVVTGGGETPHVEENVEGTNSDTRQKRYSYYTVEEVRDLVINSGWEILEMKEEDHREMSDYVTHSQLHVFATRRNE